MPNENYERGLEKLKLWTRGQICDWFHCLIPGTFVGRMHEDHEIPAIDLRTDAAFAWRVVEVLLNRFNADDVWFGQCAEGRFCVIGDPEAYRHLESQPVDVTGKTLGDALYAAVCQLGESDGRSDT
jgi:hypothetical protein